MTDLRQGAARRGRVEGRAGCERAQRLVPLPRDDATHVCIVRMEHTFAPCGRRVLETVLSGGQPHQQRAPGPVRRLGSPYRGVSFHSCTQRWRGRIKHGAKSQHLGYFASDLEAAKRYNAAARAIHGEGAQLNDGVDMVCADASRLFRTRLLEDARVPYVAGPHPTTAPSRAATPIKQESLQSPQQQPWAALPPPHQLFGADVSRALAAWHHGAPQLGLMGLQGALEPVSEPEWALEDRDSVRESDELFMQLWLDDAAAGMDPGPAALCRKRGPAQLALDSKRVRSF